MWTVVDVSMDVKLHTPGKKMAQSMWTEVDVSKDVKLHTPVKKV
jgi:hypothetical protein